MARETPDALQAFEDYWAMGDARSLPKLAQQYAARSVAGESVPTKRENTLKMWSAGHNWQARVAQRITEEAERVREEEHKRNKAFRDRVRTGIECDVRKYLQSLENANGPVLAEDAASLERMTKLFLALGGDPVADKTVQEHTGSLQVQTIPLPVFGPNDPLNHFDHAQEEPDTSGDDDPGE